MTENIKIVCTNKKASHNYFLEEKFEAGLVLLGTEVKSLREGQVNLNDSYALVKADAVYLLNCHVSPYKAGNQFNHEPTRTRKLLLHKSEIDKLWSKTQTKGYSLIPTKIYFLRGRAKVELALAKGKKKGDKRETIKKREQDRETQRAIKVRK
ncbi:MAG: SsrA-binding protein [Deltaproteobacteria bacterium GWA2_38_16]|nr:MAG: SsrA-binding protein [Deltaproteobacteria bacterium GWA2_38_16]OGQ03580.1 MAG: SsrA-binding protein [Deltaproteobacteria bacterium RIFCSPHIGHO2_02_FULL_38_15]OGQ64035.1 MAG: SsrA-binding protein [Deltaproteobacteria bacterium RIFCSPLOWO2_12_FULL_38_8]HBQ21177.1 SsrA-binding protein [Deltaproteobacteria bacterium]